MGGGVEDKAGCDGVLDDHGPGVGRSVADVVGVVVDIADDLGEDALRNRQALHVAGAGVGGERDVDGLVGGVGEQAAFVGVDGVEQAFAAEAAGLDDRERPAIEREVRGVGDPEGAEGYGLLGGPEGDALDGEFWFAGWGTRADSFLRMVMGSVRLYSKKSSKAAVVVWGMMESAARSA